MGSVCLSDAHGLKPFDCSETAGISARWERWLRAFELFATEKGVKNGDQKKALLLHTAGLNLQDIYFTLTEEGGSDSYQKAKATLNKYSSRKRMFRMKGFGFVKQVNWQTKPSNSLLLD